MNTLIALRLLLQDLLHEANRSLLTLLYLSLIIAMHLSITSLAGALSRSTQDMLTGPQNLLLLSADILDPTDSVIQAETLQSAAAHLASAQGEGAVRKASPLFLRHLRIEGHVFQLAAAPPADFEDVFQLRLLEGAWPAGSRQAAASRSVLALIGKALGDSLLIYGAPFTISAVVDAPGDRADLWLSLDAGQALFGAGRGFQVGVLQLASWMDPAAAQALLEQVLGAEGYAVYQERQFSAQFSLSLQDMLAAANFFNLVSLLVISFGVYNITHLSLAERSAEIGILRTVGFSPARVRNILLLRTALMALLAFGLGWLAVFAYVSAAQQPLMVYNTPLHLELTPLRTVYALALCLLFTALGVWLPGLQQQRQAVAAMIQEGA